MCLQKRLQRLSERDGSGTGGESERQDQALQGWVPLQGWLGTGLGAGVKGGGPGWGTVGGWQQDWHGQEPD